MKIFVTVFLVFSVLFSAESAKILGVFHFPSYSHYQLGAKLLKTLAERGHDVTVISPYTEKSPLKNYKEIILNDCYEGLDEVKKNLYNQQNMYPISSAVWLDTIGAELTDTALNHPNVQKLLKSDEKFDLVLLEQFVNEAFRGFCHKFGAHCVVLNPILPGRWSNAQMGNPGSPSYVPDMTLSYASVMSFFQRLNNAFVSLVTTVYFHLVSIPRQNEILQKHFPGAPHLNDLYYNTSFMILNSHVSVNAPVPTVPNMVTIGGYHISAPKALPKNIQEDIENAKNGAILFSMGSNLQSKYMPAEKRDALLKAFSKLKETVLWKWEDDSLPGQPPNVKLYKWLPQQDVLAHPNVKLFISHGGGLSTLETIYNGVPVIGIPVFGDQDVNIANAELAGYALRVPFGTLTEEALSKALTEILNNKKYAENAKRRSQIMHDEPTKPLDKAMFWIEYVIRHNGAPHLRTAALNLTWYQYLLLDVIAFYAAVFLFGSFIVCKTIKKLCCSKKSKVKATNQKKKKN